MISHLPPRTVNYMRNFIRPHKFQILSSDLVSPMLPSRLLWTAHLWSWSLQSARLVRRYPSLLYQFKLFKLLNPLNPKITTSPSSYLGPSLSFIPRKRTQRTKSQNPYLVWKNAVRIITNINKVAWVIGRGFLRYLECSGPSYFLNLESSFCPWLQMALFPQNSPKRECDECHGSNTCCS